MNLSLSKFDDKDSIVWNELNNSSEHSTFLTSLEWIRFQKSLGREIEQYFIKNENDPIGILYVEFHRRKIAKYAYAPYNPIIDWKKLGLEFNDLSVDLVFTSLKPFFKQIILEKKVNVFRFDQFVERKYINGFKKAGFKKSLAIGQSKDSLILDISRSANEIKAGMTKKSRWELKKALENDLEFIIASTEEHVKEFSKLMSETTSRKNFANFDEDHFLKEFRFLKSFGVIDIFLIKYKNQYTAAALFNYFNKSANYTHGCSTSDKELQKISTPRALHWNIINYLKTKGFETYNMWGVIPDGVKKHSQMGVSNFKKSWGGKILPLTGVLEIYNNPLKYYFTRFLEYFLYKKDRYKDN